MKRYGTALGKSQPPFVPDFKSLCGIDLEDLPGLRELSLRDNQISGLKSMENLPGLTTLFIRHNHISDITPLTKLTGLTKLGLATTNHSAKPQT